MTEPEPTNPIDGKKEEIMVRFTAAQIEEHGKKILERFDDGFQWTDLFTLIPETMEIVETVKGMSGEEKQAAVEGILDYVIDQTDIPWLPDSFVDPILKKGVRYIVPMIAKAAKGEFAINGDPKTGKDAK